MKRLSILAFCTGCAMMSLFSLGCPTVGPQYPVQYGPATPTPSLTTSVTLIGTTTYTFNPAAVTIAPGGSITFVDTTGFSSHIIYVDNGAGTGTCIPGGITVPASSSIVVTVPFGTAGTYHYHCSIHSPTCGTSVCSAACTGMTGVVYIP